MLGLGKFKKAWQWGACGKHPVARDYFKISHNTPVFDAFESWAEKGYAALKKSQKLDQEVYSWRFFAKGLKKGDLISGVVKDSSDSIGRPFPLLIIGEGKLDGCEEHWELLPYYFEKTWDQLEYISSRRLTGLSDFEKEIKSIKRPDENGQGHLQSFEEAINRNQPVHIDEAQVQKTADTLSRERMVVIPLDINNGVNNVTKNDVQDDVNKSVRDDALEQSGYQADYYADFLARAGIWSSRLKTYGSGMPNAVFIGGAREKHYIAVFSRPIKMDDFVRLWSASSR